MSSSNSSAASLRKASDYTASPTLSIPGKARLTRELQRMHSDPPPGVAAFLENEHDLTTWRAEIVGPPDSPFENGVFELVIKFSSRYPMEPPSCRFVATPTPHHPNIDAEGRICLDTLKSPPAGTWSPAVSLSSLLLSLRALLAEPNPDDGLVAEISQQYRLQPEQWRAEARQQTKVMMENKSKGTKRQVDDVELSNNKGKGSVTGKEDNGDADRKRQKYE